MFNELVTAREIIHVGEASLPDHGIMDDHHSAEDWRAFFNALEHSNPFERRAQAQTPPVHPST